MKLESNFLQVEVENVSMGAFEVVFFFFKLCAIRKASKYCQGTVINKY